MVDQVDNGCFWTFMTDSLDGCIDVFLICVNDTSLMVHQQLQIVKECMQSYPNVRVVRNLFFLCDNRQNKIFFYIFKT